MRLQRSLAALVATINFERVRIFLLRVSLLVA
jgi:hypothetical protein